MKRKIPCKEGEFATSTKNDVFGYKSKYIQNIRNISENIRIYSDSNKCTQVVPVSPSKPLYFCRNCDKTFKHKCNLYRHINTLRCPNMSKKEIKKIINTCKNKEIQKIKNKNKNSSIIISDNSNNNPNTNNLINNNISNCNNITNSNNNITNNINIQLRPFGKENLESIDEKQILSILNDLYMSFPNALKTIHYKIPENHNFCLPNKSNRKFISYFNGEQCIYENSTKFKDKLCNKIMDQLEEWFENHKQKILNHKKQILSKVFNTFYNGELNDRYYEDVEKYLLSYSTEMKETIDDTIKELKKQKQLNASVIKSLKKGKIKKSLTNNTNCFFFCIYTCNYFFLFCFFFRFCSRYFSFYSYFFSLYFF